MERVHYRRYAPSRLYGVNHPVAANTGGHDSGLSGTMCKVIYGLHPEPLAPFSTSSFYLNKTDNHAAKRHHRR